jgi:hypothetical protein
VVRRMIHNTGGDVRRLHFRPNCCATLSRRMKGVFPMAPRALSRTWGDIAKENGVLTWWLRFKRVDQTEGTRSSKQSYGLGPFNRGDYLAQNRFRARLQASGSDKQGVTNGQEIRSKCTDTASSRNFCLDDLVSPWKKIFEAKTFFCFF